MAPVIIFIMAGSFLFVSIYGKIYPKDPVIEKKSAAQTFLKGYSMNQESYAEIFSALQKTTSGMEISAGIVPHHFLAKGLIAGFYNGIGNKNISTVFLVSPDHYGNFYKSGEIAYTSGLAWQTPFGNLYADEAIIDSIVNDGGVSTNDAVVGLEHGISVETPFIRFFFGQARIVTLVLKNTAGYDDFFKLGQKIKKIAGRSIMVVSSDFSHGLSESEAKNEDEESIRNLNGLSVAGLDSIHNDCRPCLAVLAGFLGDGRNSFLLADNKDSRDFSGDDGGTVTSYVSGYYAK
ncbi:MAG: AmmeMemoRadiSam system protein B [Candidatus Paceibacterota bacterium]